MIVRQEQDFQSTHGAVAEARQSMSRQTWLARDTCTTAAAANPLRLEIVWGTNMTGPYSYRDFRHRLKARAQAMAHEAPDPRFLGLHPFSILIH